MGVKIVAQQGVVAGRVALRLGGQPTLGGVDLAILFDLAILRRDELRLIFRYWGVGSRGVEIWRNSLTAGALARVAQASFVRFC